MMATISIEFGDKGDGISAGTSSTGLCVRVDNIEKKTGVFAESVEEDKLLN